MRLLIGIEMMIKLCKFDKALVIIYFVSISLNAVESHSSLMEF